MTISTETPTHENSHQHGNVIFKDPLEDKECGICDKVKNIARSFQRAVFNKPPIPPNSSWEPFPSPPDADELGRQTWTFLHTMAAYYPENPTIQQQRQASLLFYGLAELYPCHICAEHLKDELQVHPPRVDSRKSLSMWLCEMHNEVNEILGKPVFDCSKVFERWKIGYKKSSNTNP